MYAKQGKIIQEVWNRALIFAFLTAVTLVGAADLAAQRPSAATEAPAMQDILAMMGSWRNIPNRGGFDEATACAEIKDAWGKPVSTCGVAFDKIKDHLHTRAFAWLRFVEGDEHISSKWACAAPQLPVLLDNFTWTLFRPNEGQELRVQYGQAAGGWLRYIWMDGRSHPSAHELFFQGHSIGWWEGKDLVVETTNFTFDADGIEDHIHLPSSHLKKLTERYTLASPDKMTLAITIEDPLFLVKPFTYSYFLQRAPYPKPESDDCDPRIGLEDLDLSSPDKYEGKTRRDFGFR